MPPSFSRLFVKVVLHIEASFSLFLLPFLFAFFFLQSTVAHSLFLFLFRMKHVYQPQSTITATTERIPTTTWGPFTIITIVSLVLVTCIILNCHRIRRSVTGRRAVHQSGQFEKTHKEMQQVDIESNADFSSFRSRESQNVTVPDTVYNGARSARTDSGYIHITSVHTQPVYGYAASQSLNMAR